MGPALCRAARGTRAAGLALSLVTVARHWQGRENRQPRASKRRQLPRSASSGSNSMLPDRETVLFLIVRAPGIERRAAARHFRSGNRPSVCGKSGNARAPENALPAHVCGHQSREPRSSDAVEGGKHLAALYRRRELLDCAPWTTASTCGARRRSDDAPPHARARCREKTRKFSRGFAATLSAHAGRQRNA